MSVIFKVDPKDLEIDEKVLLAKAIINGKRDLRNVKSKELTPMETQELFEKTSIPFRKLPVEIQTEIRQGKSFSGEKELFDFLENYSS